MPVIALSLFDPEGKILAANNLIIDSNGIFSKVFSLDSPFYDAPGKYTVKLNYGKIVQNEFFTISGNTSEPGINTLMKTLSQLLVLFLALILPLC
jgi:hypothetical protein